MQTEFVRSLNCNYERILLDKKPEERKYQYCILNRGGIRGLLPCNLRYINGVGYLYYDISSKQNVKQRYSTKTVTREWIKEFVWSYGQIRMELERFLLDSENILWYPEQIFQDVETNSFSFLYVPYYSGDSGFRKLLEFWVEKIDYDDEVLVDCVYKMYEQYETDGDAYLQAKVFEDVKILDIDIRPQAQENTQVTYQTDASTSLQTDMPAKARIERKNTEDTEPDFTKEYLTEVADEEAISLEKSLLETKKGILSLFENRKKKNREQRESYRQSMQDKMLEYAVAEEPIYEEYGKTIFVEPIEQESRERELRMPNGKIVAVLDRENVTIGKRKGDADVVLDDVSVSRIHARVVREEGKYYIEDMNSTNGTFKNGLSLQPYERRELEEGDEVKIGRVMLNFV